jgi:cobalt/nickel transport system permease protein
MHIAEGVLSVPVLAAGAVLTAAGTGIGLYRLDHEKIPRAGLMAAVFFVASLIHVPIGPSSAHLILNGLAGLLLGWAAFPAILIALLLQAVFFQYGGLTALGVNTFAMAAPGAMCGVAVRPLLRRGRLSAAAGGFLCGSVSVLGACLLMAAAQVLTSEGFVAAATALLIAHVPIAVVEGIVVAFAAGFLAKVKPALLGLEAPGAKKQD